MSIQQSKEALDNPAPTVMPNEVADPVTVTPTMMPNEGEGSEQRGHDKSEDLLGKKKEPKEAIYPLEIEEKKSLANAFDHALASFLDKIYVSSTPLTPYNNTKLVPHSEFFNRTFKLALVSKMSDFELRFKTYIKAQEKIPETPEENCMADDAEAFVSEIVHVFENLEMYAAINKKTTATNYIDKEQGLWPDHSVRHKFSLTPYERDKKPRAFPAHHELIDMLKAALDEHAHEAIKLPMKVMEPQESKEVKALRPARRIPTTKVDHVVIIKKGQSLTTAFEQALELFLDTIYPAETPPAPYDTDSFHPHSVRFNSSFETTVKALIPTFEQDLKGYMKSQEKSPETPEEAATAEAAKQFVDKVIHIFKHLENHVALPDRSKSQAAQWHGLPTKAKATRQRAYPSDGILIDALEAALNKHLHAIIEQPAKLADQAVSGKSTQR